MHARALPASGTLPLWFRRVGDTSRRQELRHVQARHANAVVGHPVVDVETIRRAEIVAPVDAGGEHDVGDGAAAFLPAIPALNTGSAER